MKGIHNIYICAAILCLFLCYAGNAWGQTNGNQYEDVGGNSEISASLEDYSSETTGYRNNHYARYAIDNSNTTYWLSDENREDNPWLILQIGSDNAFKQLQIRSDNRYYRPQSVTIEASNSSNNGWTRIGTYTTNFSNNIATITLTEAVNQSYIRLTFERNNNNQVRIYDLAFYSESEGVAIQHKPAKWFDMRDGNNYVDTFNDELQMITSGDGKTQIQAAHTYVDTLYVKKGSQVSLLLPTLSGNAANSSNSAAKYQRWYNYLTEGTFATGLTGNQQVNDLLTPMNNATAYRFVNGYAGGNGLMDRSSVMSGAYFYYPNDDNNYTVNNGSAGNNYYVVACDVSGYTDFTNEFTPGQGGSFTDNYIEPTLSLRVIYYIVGIDDDNWGDYLNDYDRLNTNAYQGGTNNGNERYLEEYEITFPCDHISNHTSELVAIARNGQFYRVPGDNNGTLNVSLAEQNSVIQLATTTLTDDRIISFRKAGADANEAWSIDDGETATILVTKRVTSGNGWNQTTTTYNIARFKLTFKKNTRLLTQHQIDRLDKHRKGTETISNESWYDSEYLYRTPDYLENGGNYILLTSRTFDYDQTMASEPNIQTGYYPYPLSWDFSSYAFFDGSTSADFYKSVSYPEWGSYGIVRNYIGYGDHNTNVLPDATLGGRTDGYFIYVDASSRPGQLVTLPFRENLCAGSELLVSAWVKSSAESSSDDAAMLFIIYGVDKEGNRTPIHCQSTGQIRKTTHFTSGRGEYTSENGYGSDRNDWYQVFLSFVNDDPEVANFDSYELRVDNNCASTTGGDYYLDDIRVYISKPLAQVQQLETACTTGRTLMNLQLNWERLMARVGGENINVTHNLAICFIDTLAFHNAYDGTNIVDAIEASAVELGQEGQSYSFRVLNYNTVFDYNTTYNPDEINLASVNDDAFYGLTMGEDNMQALAVDFYGSLTPGRTYWITLVPDVPNSEISETDGVRTVNPSVFSSFYADVCAITTDFLVTGNTTIKVDGEIVKPETEFCRGNVSNFTIELKIPDLSTEAPDDSVVISDGIYFDWFFGEAREGQIADPQRQYTEKVRVNGNSLIADANGVSLEEALLAFRNEYPNATDLDATTTPVTEDFTQSMYNLINYYLHTAEAPDGAMNRTLVLHQSSLNITLLETLRVVVKPIPMSISTDDLDNWGYDTSEWMALCWGYTYLELTTTNEAPSVYPGFNTIQYPEPENLTDQSLRIGLKQIESVSTSNNNKTLTIDLREAKSYKENNYDFTLQLIGGNQNPDETYNKLFLIATDDPDMYEYIERQGADFDQRSLPIGVIQDFEAHYYQTGTTSANNRMEVQFILEEQTLYINGESTNFTFIPREGYSYTFMVYFEEQTDWGEMTACYGRFPLTMKVVPEYLVWEDTQKGDGEIEIGNWNNDANWKRATNADIKAINTIEDYQNDNRAFVPMLFSKVIMPRDSKVELYAAGYGSTGSWNNEDRPDYIADPTPNIQYDLMAYDHPNDGLLKTERYRVSLLDQIHFEPGAEMLHAEYLLYDKAWVDYELDGGRWYTLASPLQGVVAGDFYAPTSGRQETEYFQPITFDTDKGYNRFNPSVYQRAWKASEATLQTLNHRTKEMAISGNWSSLYNDVDEAYTPGTGFSLKVQDLTNNSALFRLPKADDKYYYYENGNTTGGNETTITRTDEEGNSLSGRLMSDKIYHRTETETSYNGTVTPMEITIPLSESANGEYYLVGNPFMAHLDMEAFFAENGGENGVLEDKYWYVAEDGVQNIAITDPDGENTSWTNAENAGLIPPLHSFFVKKKESATTDATTTVTFTADMQTLATETDGTNTNALILTAQTADGKTSRAAIAYDATAKATYETSEDAELFLDSNLSDVPTIYTVAGTMATSINRTSELYNIPVGIYGNSTEMVTLSFDGLKNFSSATLYDAEKRTETPLREGTTITLPANTSGRYFLRAGAPTANESIATDAIQIYTLSGNRVMVTSTTPLKDIRVYTISGALVKQAKGGFCSHELYLPEDGIYVISAKSANGAAQTAKVAVN